MSNWADNIFVNHDDGHEISSHMVRFENCRFSDDAGQGMDVADGPQVFKDCRFWSSSQSQPVEVSGVSRHA